MLRPGGTNQGYMATKSYWHKMDDTIFTNKGAYANIVKVVRNFGQSFIPTSNLNIYKKVDNTLKLICRHYGVDYIE